jgi:hypothetical protein
LEEKQVISNITVPSALIRLAMVLAEIAQNEPNSASTAKPVCASETKIERNTENTAGG